MSRGKHKHRESPHVSLKGMIETLYARGWPQAHIAAHLGCSESWVSQVVTGVATSKPRDESMPAPMRDEDHVRAVLAEGGHPAVHLLGDGKPVWLDQAGRPWRHVRSILP